MEYEDKWAIIVAIISLCLAIAALATHDKDSRYSTMNFRPEAIEKLEAIERKLDLIDLGFQAFKWGNTGAAKRLRFEF